MKLGVFVHDTLVATLESLDGVRHVLTYHPGVPPELFVSLLMPVRTESYVYEHDIHPFFRMNMPEGFLLSVLQEQLGPHIGASPLSLLAVVGRNAIGRVKVAPEGADPTQAPVAFDMADILRGDNSEAAFVDLVRRYAVSGVSGVVPKFLSPNALGPFGKGTLHTDRYIIKGTTSRFPGVAVNEHLCMEVSRRAGIATAQTELSDDGQALVVHRFDFEGDDGMKRRGMEDLCSLLLLKPENKYESTWERVVNRIGQTVGDAQRRFAALSQLADLLLLTYALRNADCHTKNIALLYSSREDVRLADVYDMLTINVYDAFAKNPPGMSVGGGSKWMPGKTLETFLQVRCGILPEKARERIERICEAMVEVTPMVIEAMDRHPHFKETGKRMVHVWNDGMNSLRLKKTWSLPSLDETIAQARFSDLKPMKPAPPEKIGRSPLLGKR